MQQQQRHQQQRDQSMSASAHRYHPQQKHQHQQQQQQQRHMSSPEPFWPPPPPVASDHRAMMTFRGDVGFSRKRKRSFSMPFGERSSSSSGPRRSHSMPRVEHVPAREGCASRSPRTSAAAVGARPRRTDDRQSSFLAKFLSSDEEDEDDGYRPIEREPEDVHRWKSIKREDDDDQISICRKRDNRRRKEHRDKLAQADHRSTQQDHRSKESIGLEQLDHHANESPTSKKDRGGIEIQQYHRPAASKELLLMKQERDDNDTEQASDSSTPETSSSVNDARFLPLLPTASFPERLRRMLDDASKFDFEGVVSWLDDEELKVHDPTEFIASPEIRRYFPSVKYKSFQRQLNLYDFTRNPTTGGYSHPRFKRSDPPTVAATLTRTKKQRPKNIKTNKAASGISLDIEPLSSSDPFLFGPIENSAEFDLGLFDGDEGDDDHVSLVTPPPSSCESSSAPQPSQQAFPWKVYDMLEGVRADGLEHVVRWRSGSSFKIFDPIAFEKTILPRYFTGLTRYESFRRQLNFYGFSRLRRGPDRGTCSHALLKRGDRESCAGIRRTHNNPVNASG